MVTGHSDQSSQYRSHDWKNLLNANNHQASVSRRGNSHENAVAQDFFQILPCQRVKRHIYAIRNDTRTVILEYFTMVYNKQAMTQFQ